MDKQPIYEKLMDVLLEIEKIHGENSNLALKQKQAIDEFLMLWVEITN